MPTNTKEYMKKYQRERRAKLKKPLPNIVKKVVKNVKGPYKQSENHSTHYKRSLVRGIRAVLGGSDTHIRGQTIISDAQDIIDILTKFIEKEKKRKL